MEQFQYVSPRLGKIGGAERKRSCRANKVGGGSIYQALPYVMRGAGRKSRKIKGGFYPSLMGGVLSNGPLLMSAAVAQGSRLLSNESERMKHRKTRRNRSKRTSKSRKNTRKA